MKPPIVVDNRGDILVFESVDEAERYMEPVDVLRGDYAAYDSGGGRLRIEVVSEGRRERTRLRPGGSSPEYEEHLRALIVEFLSRTKVGRPQSPEVLGTDELIRLLPRLK